MRREDPLAEIRRRWKVRSLVLEWQRLPKEARADVVAELEGSARATGGDDGRSRLIAADALEAMESPLLLQGLEGIAEDVQQLLAEIDRLRPGGPA